MPQKLMMLVNPRWLRDDATLAHVYTLSRGDEYFVHRYVLRPAPGRSTPAGLAIVGIERVRDPDKLQPYDPDKLRRHVVKYRRKKGVDAGDVLAEFMDKGHKFTLISAQMIANWF